MLNVNDLIDGCNLGKILVQWNVLITMGVGG